MSKINLTKEEKANVFRALQKFSTLKVGQDFGFDKKYTNKEGLRTFIYNVKKEVQGDPESFGITKEMVQTVKEELGSRQIAKNSEEFNLEDVDITSLMGNITKKVMWHLDNKLTKKDLKNVSLVQLATVMGISIEKMMLLSGKATENIAFKAQIDVNMSSDKLLDQLLNHRQTYVKKGKN